MLKIGKYILFNKKLDFEVPLSSEFESVNTESGEHFLCSSFPKKEFEKLFWKPYVILQKENFTKPVQEIIFGEKKVYVFISHHEETLYDYLSRCKRKGTVLCVEESLRIFKRIVTIVKTCEEKGVIIRRATLGRFVFMDSTKENIYLKNVSESIVLETGNEDNWSLRSDLERNQSTELTPPEGFVQDERSLTQRSANRWCLGLSLYLLMFKRFPFHIASHGGIEQIRHVVTRCEYTLPDSLSYEVKTLLRGLLHKDPSLRFTLEETLAHPCFTRYKTLADKKNTADDECKDQVVPNMCSNER